MLLAGEPSGDAYGGALARTVAARWPDARVLGTGGVAMREAGVELLAGLDDLSVMGFAEVVPRLAWFRALERRLVARLAEVDLLIAIDFPGFNLRLARAAKARGVPVLYYIAPKVWAWRPGRARTLAACADRVASVLPFEISVLERAGVRATFVGHPLLDLVRDPPDRSTFAARWGLLPERPILALLPGSRRQEVARHLSLFLDAAERVSRVRPDVQPVIGRAGALPAELYAGAGVPIVDDAPALLAHAAAALLKSGTVTLEAALAGVPSVVAYRTSPLTWAVARRLLRVEHVSLPNLVLGRRAVPELLQERATPVALSEALVPLLDTAGPERAAQLESLGRVREALGAEGATTRVVDMAERLLEDRG